MVTERNGEHSFRPLQSYKYFWIGLAICFPTVISAIAISQPKQVSQILLFDAMSLWFPLGGIVYVKSTRLIVREDGVERVSAIPLFNKQLPFCDQTRVECSPDDEAWRVVGRYSDAINLNGYEDLGRLLAVLHETIPQTWPDQSFSQWEAKPPPDYRAVWIVAIAFLTPGIGYLVSGVFALRLDHLLMGLAFTAFPASLVATAVDSFRYRSWVYKEGQLCKQGRTGPLCLPLAEVTIVCRVARHVRSNSDIGSRSEQFNSFFIGNTTVGAEISDTHPQFEEIQKHYLENASKLRYIRV